MCICINCAFYKTCWIKKGINKIPKNYVNLSLNTNISIKKILIVIQNEVCI